jgi:succinyl-diaminopimelate desuccinylase
MPAALDCIELTRRLIRCPSITPADGGALDLVQEVLETLGFTCHRLVFSEPGTAEVENLYARLGQEGANFCYAGHTDVVPVGEAAAWSVEPFGGELRDGWVYGRGAVDMKGSIGAFLAALAAFLERRGGGFGGSISLLITGDEEADAINGTRKVLQWLAERDEHLDACLVGEPTSNERLGDMIKIGRRGSLNGRLIVRGIQGHTAYPQLADNPLHHLVHMLETVLAEPLDHGTEHFPPSTLQLTTIDVGNAASNVIPGQASAAFNVRFNDLHTGDSVADWLRDRLDRKGADYDLEIRVSGESFLCPPGPLSDLVAQAVETVLGARPELGTTGGTSDARFIKDHAPVAELGLLNATAHKVDERVSVVDLERLSTIYGAVLDGTFPQ